MVERGYVLRMDRLQFLTLYAAVVARLEFPYLSAHERLALEQTAGEFEREAVSR